MGKSEKDLKFVKKFIKTMLSIICLSIYLNYIIIFAGFVQGVKYYSNCWADTISFTPTMETGCQ